jgi:3-deoxy-manno-octulosonate cytidylyltransferase (CMP-KDO synthetase)
MVIPARLGSQRFPRKVLAEVAGRSLLEHIWHTATQVLDAELVTVLTDADEVVAHVHGFGGRAHLTSPEARNGTERAAEHLAVHDATAVMNVQGDDPFVTPDVLHAAMAAHDADERSVMFIGGLPNTHSRLRHRKLGKLRPGNLPGVSIGRYPWQ